MSKLGPGSELGPYVIEAELGRGGMGVVYRGHHRELPDKPVALKRILTQQASETELIRFQREAQVMARVRHPNVVGVHGLEHAPGGLVLIAELVEGEPLDQVVARGGLEPREAARVVATLCSGVAALHAAEILHRDLKPANVILRPEGEPVLLDFGIAQDQSAERLTQTGTLLGSPHSMSPEQAAGETRRFGPWTDVYGLGAVLYALLNGEPPFAGRGSVLATVKAVLSDEPGWPRRAELPAELVVICEACLAKEPDQRYQDPPQLAEDLDRFLAGRPPLVAAGSAPGRGRLRLALLLLLLVLGAGLGGFLWRRVARAREQAELEQRLAKAQAEEAQARRREKEARRAAERARDAWRRTLDRQLRLDDPLPLPPSSREERAAALGLLSVPHDEAEELGATLALLRASPLPEWSVEVDRVTATYAQVWPLTRPRRLVVAHASIDQRNRLEKGRERTPLGELHQPGTDAPPRPLSRLSAKWVAAELVWEQEVPVLWALSRDPPLLSRIRIEGTSCSEQVYELPSEGKPSALAVGEQDVAVGQDAGSILVFPRAQPASDPLRLSLANDRLEVVALGFLSGRRLVACGGKHIPNNPNVTYKFEHRELSLFALPEPRRRVLSREWLRASAKPLCLLVGSDGQTFFVGVSSAWYARRIDPTRAPTQDEGYLARHPKAEPLLRARANAETQATRESTRLPGIQPWSWDSVGVRGLTRLPGSGLVLAWGDAPDGTGGRVSQVRGWAGERGEVVRWLAGGTIDDLRPSRDGRFLALARRHFKKMRVEVEVRVLRP